MHTSIISGTLNPVPFYEYFLFIYLKYSSYGIASHVPSQCNGKAVQCQHYC